MSISPLHTIRFRFSFAAGWCCWALLHAFILNRFGFPWKMAIWDSAVSNVLLAGVSLLLSITLQFYIPQKNKYAYILTLCGVLSVIALMASRTLLVMLSGHTDDYARFFSLSFPLRMAFAFLVTGCMALVSVLWYTVQDQQEIEKRKGEADRLSKEAELYKLRQQLQPHFLFNSLNSINALIGLQPQQARTMIQQLSDFLRGTLKKEEHQWMPISEELQYVQLYLDIEKVRFGHRLSAHIDDATGTATARIPAMLLQPVVENAIKFGLYDTTGDITISIDAAMREGDLEIVVKNPFDPQTTLPHKGTGFGLSSIQRRLYLLFARNDLLKTFIENDLFITTIKIPQRHD